MRERFHKVWLVAALTIPKKMGARYHAADDLSDMINL